VTGFAAVALPTQQLARLRDQAFALAESDELRPIIGTVLPLAQARAAHQAFEDRAAVGKTVPPPQDPPAGHRPAAKGPRALEARKANLTMTAKTEMNRAHKRRA